VLLYKISKENVDDQNSSEAVIDVDAVVGLLRCTVSCGTISSESV